MKKTSLATLLSFCLLASTAFAQEKATPQAKPADIFENITTHDNAVVPGIVKNPAPKLPDIQLPWDEKVGAAFTPGEKIETQAQLDAELVRMRAKYAPFMADLAPTLPKHPSLELEKCDWRYGLDWRHAGKGKDAAELAGALKGEGKWKQVTIPDYRGPVGSATSYYRTEVNLDAKMLAQDTLFLHFNGVDYYADVYVNGTHVGSHTGLFDPFEFDIKPLAKLGKNMIMVRCRNDYDGIGSTGTAARHNGPKISACGGPGWDQPAYGWVCCPSGFGIWQRAWLEARPAAHVQDISVRPMPQKHQAEVWVEMVQPKGGASVTLNYSLYGQNFKSVLAENQQAKTDAGKETEHGTRLYKFTVEVPEAQLRWWSPDEPWLYQLQVSLLQNGKVVNAAKKQFGMRTFVQSTTSTPKGRFYLNGKEIRLRGANMMGNLMRCVMDHKMDQLRDDILLAKIAHMNFYRMTQQPCQEDVYDYFDRLGLMAQTDMPNFGIVQKGNEAENLRQVEAMTKLVRSHPCNCVITYMNEPMTWVNKYPKLSGLQMIKLFKEMDKKVATTNPDQVVKWVEGDYMNLSQAYSDHHWYTLWYRGHGIAMHLAYLGAWQPTRAGWMHGCGEYGSEGLDSIAFMKKRYPAAWTKETADGKWNPNKIPLCQSAGLGKSKWFGVPGQGTMQDWVSTSQDHQKWATRLMTESLRRDPKLNSMAIHLLIDAWPAGWLKSLMNADRQAKPAYFAFRDALTPLSINLRPDTFFAYSGDPVRVGAWVCNDTQQVPADATLRYEVILDGKVVHTGSTLAKITVCAPEFQGFLKFTAPHVDKRQPMTVRMGLFDAQGKLLHESAYDIDLLPADLKGQKVPHRGGRVEQLRAS